VNKANKMSGRNTLTLPETVKWHIQQIIELISELSTENLSTRLVDEIHPGFLVYPIIEAFRWQQSEEGISKEQIYRRFGNQAFLETAREKTQIVEELNRFCGNIDDGDADHQLFLLQMLSKAAYAHGQLDMLLKESL